MQTGNQFLELVFRLCKHYNNSNKEWVPSLHKNLWDHRGPQKAWAMQPRIISIEEGWLPSLKHNSSKFLLFTRQIARKIPKECGTTTLVEPQMKQMKKIKRLVMALKFYPKRWLILKINQKVLKKIGNWIMVSKLIEWPSWEVNSRLSNLPKTTVWITLRVSKSTSKKTAARVSDRMRTTQWTPTTKTRLRTCLRASSKDTRRTARLHQTKRQERWHQESQPSRMVEQWWLLPSSRTMAQRPTQETKWHASSQGIHNDACSSRTTVAERSLPAKGAVLLPPGLVMESCRSLPELHRQHSMPCRRTIDGDNHKVVLRLMRQWEMACFWLQTRWCPRVRTHSVTLSIQMEQQNTNWCILTVNKNSEIIKTWVHKEATTFSQHQVKKSTMPRNWFKLESSTTRTPWTSTFQALKT